jgi:hypothetical protein
MSLYAPLNEAPVPSLDEVQTGKPVEVTITSAEDKKIASGGRPQVVTSYAVVSAPPSAENTRCLLTACCCGCSLSTGTLIISWLEAVSWGVTFISAVLALYVKTQENKIDHAIVKHDAEHDADADAPAPPTDAPPEPTTEEKVDQTNMMIDLAALSAPFLIIMAFIGLYFCVKGMAAAKEGSIDAAKSCESLLPVKIMHFCFIALIFFINAIQTCAGSASQSLGHLSSLSSGFLAALPAASFRLPLLCTTSWSFDLTTCRSCVLPTRPRSSNPRCKCLLLLSQGGMREPAVFFFHGHGPC